jgi:hypothetical protein
MVACPTATGSGLQGSCSAEKTSGCHAPASLPNLSSASFAHNFQAPPLRLLTSPFSFIDPDPGAAPCGQEFFGFHDLSPDLWFVELSPAMVLDPMSALSLAANIVQFVDFTSKIVSKGRRIYLSKCGALPKNLELEVVTNDLSRLAESLRNDGISTGTMSEEETSLQTMCDECSKIAEELLRRLEKLEVKSDAKQRGWKSLRQALKSVWNKEELDELSERLMHFRDQLQFRTLVSME